MTEGNFFLFYRKFWHSPNIQCLKPLQKLVAIAIISKANWSQGSTCCRNCAKPLTIPRGAVLTSYQALSDLTGVSPSVVRTSINRLAKNCFISKSNLCCNYQLLVISNYSQYQDKSSDRTEGSAEGRHKTLPRVDTYITRSNKKEKNKEDSDKASTLPDVYFSLADLLRDQILSHTPDHALSKPGWTGSKQRSIWALQAERMCRLDNRSTADTGELIRWAHDPDNDGSNGFTWRANVQSMSTLRKQFDKLRTQMRASQKATGESAEVVQLRNQWKGQG